MKTTLPVLFNLLAFAGMAIGVYRLRTHSDLIIDQLHEAIRTRDEALAKVKRMDPAKPPGASGGNVNVHSVPVAESLTVSAGKGSPPDEAHAPGPGGSLIFNAPDGTELFRWDGDGRAYVRGRYVETDRETYEGIAAWFRTATVQR